MRQTWCAFDELPHVLLDTPGGLVVILGGPDTGKTTLLKRAALAQVKAGRRVGLVDSDVGQSTIGPPTTIGMFVAEDDLPGDFWPHAMYFVGNNNPVGHITELVVGSRRMVDKAQELGAETVLFDSSGLIQPPYGVILKYHKLGLLRPHIVVALERQSELAPILQWLSCNADVELLRARPPKEVHVVSTSKRTRYRQEQYQRYFANATQRNINRQGLCLYPPNFLNGKVDPIGLLVGLQDKRWDTVAIGIVESLNQDEVCVAAPYPPQAEIHGLVGGYMKLSRDGIETGRVHPRQLL